VTAVAVTSDSKRIISGGGEGQVRVWEVSPQLQTMKEAMKEHKGISNATDHGILLVVQVQ